MKLPEQDNIMEWHKDARTLKLQYLITLWIYFDYIEILHSPLQIEKN